MTIISITSAYGPQTGGIRTQLDNLRAQYAARGVDSVLIIPGETDSATTDHAGRVFTIASPRSPFQRQYRNIVNLGAARRIIEHIRPDCVEIVDKYTLPALGPWLRTKGIPSVGFSTERLADVAAPYLGRSALVRATARRWNRWFAGCVDTVVCHSRFAALDLLAVGADNVVVVPLGVDLETYRPDMRREELRRELLGDADVLLLYVGRLVPEKSVGLLADMMAKLAGGTPKFRLAVVGSGGEAAKVAAAPNTVLLGFQRHPEKLAELYASADLFVFPSAIETFGLGVLEAMASGCPVVSADRGAVVELARPEFAVQAAAGGEAFARAVRSLAARPREPAGAAARRAAEQYGWDAAAGTILGVEGCLRGRDPRAE